MKSERIKSLWADSRNYIDRLKLSAFISVAAAYTLLLFSAIELYFGNLEKFDFYLGEFVGAITILAVVVALINALILSLLRGKIFDLFLSLELGILLAAYLQGNFLNLELGELDGASIGWSQYAVHGIINLVVWFVIILLPLVVRYFSKKVWTKVVMWTPLLLSFVQVIAMVTLFVSNGSQVVGQREYKKYLSTEGQYELSSDENIVVFIVDYLDKTDIDDLQAQNSDYLAQMADFTYFDDYIGNWYSTFPAVVQMFTGDKYEPGETRKTYFTRAWERGQNELFADINNADYQIKFYEDAISVYDDAREFGQSVINIGETTKENVNVNLNAIVKGFVKISAYKYAPHALKASFWVSTEILSEAVTIQADDKYVLRDHEFYRGLLDGELSLHEGKNDFIVYHFRGAHPPYYTSDAGYDATRSEAVDASFELINEYLNKMKELGVYDKSTIIVTADHGNTAEKVNNGEEMFPVVVPLFIKPQNQTNSVMEVNHAMGSHENFRATLCEAAGIDTDKYGVSVWNAPENDEVVREFYWPSDRYIVVGTAHDKDNWSLAEG